MTTPTVAAVVVSYHPDAGALAALLAALQAAPLHAVIVVDNASPQPPVVAGGMQLIRLDRNLGVGAAQNVGIRAALQGGAAQVLLLDQDSLPQPGMVAALQAALQAAAAAGLRPAAAGPLIVDEQGHSDGFVRFRRGRYEALLPAAGEAWIDCDLLIASGTLIPAAALRAVGEMDEGLFIDKVDTEWCLRAAAAGWQLLGVPAARLHHRLGQRQLRLWFFGWRRLALHAPFRYYYMWRNGLLLRRRAHATAAWKRADARQLRSLLLYFGLLAPGRWARLRMMGRGLADGWRGHTGALDR
ncbi:MAG: glycosyltransferase family 2 protein [Proteobacteria bacterium]|nr:glycosyltransferase family 2 protein [Pseudomonadota bacterium]